MSGIRTTIAAGIRGAAEVFGKTRVGRMVMDQVVDSSMNRTVEAVHGDVRLKFTAPNRLNHFRVQSFATKEPETLAWIDTIPRGSVLWDIGANIGLYSCYAAKARGCRVFAFEPSVFNLELLARNIFLNELQGAITIVPLPLFERVAVDRMNMSSTQWGGALSTFGATHGFDGQALQAVFEFNTVGLSLDDCASRLHLPAPDYIKMDVDGIEHIIMRGGAQTLQRLRGISVEINDDFAEQASQSRAALEQAGLKFVSKAHSEMIEANPTFRHTFNQVWAR